ncbi:MAG: hypothetical protein NT106_09525, partial [Candidatus Sumerlaeota bacterium]|nr:hypothetical protein [Candidatus Sumerlaeota bacterium]
MNIKYSPMKLFLVLVLILNMAAWAQLPCPLRLGDVGQAGGVAGVRIKGATATQYPNLALTGIGDLNGDGLDDFALGFIAGDGTPGYFRIVPGSREGIGTGGVLDVSAGVKGATRNPKGVGISIAGLGDANANGFYDVLFGAPSVDTSGAAYFVDGFSFIELMLSQKTQPTEWIEAHSGTRLDGIGDGDD